MRLVDSDILREIPWLRHGVFAPSWKDGQPDPADNLSFVSGRESEVTQARKRVAELLEADASHFTHVYQVHGAKVIPVTLVDRGKGSSRNRPQVGEGDALITADPGLPIAILVADCIPVFLVDRNRRAVGLAHAGWRGAAAGVCGETVRAMRKCFDTEPADLVAWIGPGISRCCFEVGPEVIEQFRSTFQGWEDCWSVSPRRIDLKKILFRSLQANGIPERGIEVSSDCTVCQPGYFSYRCAGPLTGHNMAAVVIVE